MMGSDDATVSVIIPTTCQRGRAPLIDRAIASITGQNGVCAQLIVVVNGNQIDPDLFGRLSSSSALRVLTLDEGNVSAARHLGLTKARGEYFCFLDDDDELLPDSLSHRVRLLRRETNVDFLVTNGFIHIDGTDSPLVDDHLADRINEDPGGSALIANYFASAAPLFRAQAIDIELFDIRLRYFELSFLLFRLLSLNKRLHYEHCTTYRIYGDNELSVSKSEGYALSYPTMLKELKQLPLDRRIHGKLGAKYAAALHAVSSVHLSHHRLREAWKSHVMCLVHGGWGYVPYTRHLLRAVMRGRSPARTRPADTVLVDSVDDLIDKS